MNTTTASRKRHAPIDLQKNSELSTEDGGKMKKRKQRIRLKAQGHNASLSTVSSERIPLTLTNVQYLLVHSQLGNRTITHPPRWYALDKPDGIVKTACLILEGISIKYWEQYGDEFNDTRQIFKPAHTFEILTPSVYGGSLVKELAIVPFSEAEKDTIIPTFGSMNLALEARKDVMIMMKALFPIGDGITNEVTLSTEDKFPRTQLVLETWQLIEENYPVPLKGKLSSKYAEYVLTKDEYAPVTATSPMYGIDCEMCRTKAGSELTRISVVSEKHEAIYESLVKPYNDIRDYLTKYSGITKSSLINVTKRLQDVQDDLRAILPPDAILVGQSVDKDMHALQMMHPYIIDTSLSYNYTGDRHVKPKLKRLAREFLNEDIQMGTDGHCSTEDSLAALKLVQLKLSKSIVFGDTVHTKREKFKDYNNDNLEQKESSVIIGCDDITGDYHTYLTQAKESMSAQLKKGNPKKIKLATVDRVEEVITSFTSSVTDYNLTMAHLKLDFGDDKQVELINKINMWIKSIWDCLEHSSLFVVVFGGTKEDNGLLLMKVKPQYNFKQ